MASSCFRLLAAAITSKSHESSLIPLLVGPMPPRRHEVSLHSPPHMPNSSDAPGAALASQFTKVSSGQERGYRQPMASLTTPTSSALYAWHSPPAA
jgi:hypothetical protein